MSILRFSCFCLLLSLLTACNPERVKYTRELRQEMADSKIKRVTNADVVETVDNLGERICAVVQKDLTSALQQTTNPDERTKRCQLRSLPRIVAIEKQYGVNVRLLGARDIQDKTLNAKERGILDAYFYNAKQKLTQVSNIQPINDTLFIYNAAVPADNLICEACFGKQETPFAIWRVAFPKREVIRRMKTSKKK